MALAFLAVMSSVSLAQRKKQVAVLDFEFIAADHQRIAQFAYGDPQNLSKQIISSLENHLVQQKNYVVVERERVAKILYEQNLGATGRIDASTAAQIGKLMGADEVIYGSVTMLEMEGMPQGRRSNETWNPRNLKSRIGVHFRMVDTTSGQLKVAHEVIGLSKRPAAGEKEESGAKGFFKQLGKDILTNKSANDGPKPEQVGEVIRLAVNDSILSMARLMEESATQAQVQPKEEAPAITGEILSVNHPMVVIIGLDKSKIREGDRFDVRRVMSETASGKVFTYTDKVGEVEIVEIQSQVVRGSFFGPAPARKGDLVTNTANIDPSKLKNATPASPQQQSATPPNQKTATPAQSQPATPVRQQTPTGSGRRRPGS